MKDFDTFSKVVQLCGQLWAKKCLCLVFYTSPKQQKIAQSGHTEGGHIPKMKILNLLRREREKKSYFPARS